MTIDAMKGNGKSRKGELKMREMPVLNQLNVKRHGKGKRHETKTK